MQEFYDVQVISPDGKIGRIPKEDLGLALRDGYKLKENRIRVINPNGKIGSIPEEDLDIALKDGFQIAPPNLEPTEDSKSSYLDDAKLGAQALASGVTQLADIPQSVATLVDEYAVNPFSVPLKELSNLYNTYKGRPHYNKQKEPSFLQKLEPNLASNTIKRSLLDNFGLDIEPKPVNTEQRVIKHIGEFAGGFGPFGALNKGAKAANILKGGATGAAIGGTSGIAQEMGVDPLVADIGAILAVPSNPMNLLAAFKKIPGKTAQIPMKLMGLTGKNLNLKSGQAARDLGIDLPASVLTESRLTNLADQLVGKTPYFGEKLSRKYKTAESQSRLALENIFKEIGPERTPEIEEKIAKLYNERRASLPQDAKIKPENLKKTLDKINVNTAILSADEKSLLDSLTKIKHEIEPLSKLVSAEHGAVKLPLQDFNVDKLVGTKTSLNNIIKWGKDEGVKNQLRSIRHSITKDIDAYGKTNPKWYDKYKEADKLYGDVAKRENVENALSNKAINHATDSFSYNALAKAINSPDKKKLLKSQVTPEVFIKIEKLGDVAQAMAIKNRNIPNPSGTAIISSILGAKFFTPQALVTGAGAAGMSTLLTNKKFLDLAIKLAEKPENMATQFALSSMIKKATGRSPIVLQQEMKRKQQKESK